VANAYLLERYAVGGTEGDLHQQRVNARLTRSQLLTEPISSHHYLHTKHYPHTFKMHASSILVAVAAFAGFAVAQNLDGAVFNGQNYSISGPIAVPPQNLDVGYKRKICLAQTQQCPQICGGLATKNTCDDVSEQLNNR
jgi:hypothetical protein